MGRSSMEEFLDRYPPPERPDADRENNPADVPRSAPSRAPIEDRIDLHGYTVEAAREELDRFIKRSIQAGRGKVLIIHGKGSTPGSEAPLRRMVRGYLEKNPLIGATGVADVRDGGRGATWAMIRQRSR